MDINPVFLKPAVGENAIYEIINYTYRLNKYDPVNTSFLPLHWGWGTALDYLPPPVVPAGLRSVALVFPPGPGLILYQEVDPKGVFFKAVLPIVTAAGAIAILTADSGEAAEAGEAVEAVATDGAMTATGLAEGSPAVIGAINMIGSLNAEAAASETALAVEGPTLVGAATGVLPDGRIRRRG